MSINSAIKAGVAGWPVSHSLSPRLHGYWLKQYHIDGEYGAFTVTAGDLPAFIASLRTHPDMRGVNLTIPHKEAVIPLLDEVDALAGSIGAVNTVLNKGGKLYGTNTDIYGFAENIRPHITGTQKAVVIGAGGAAKAVCKALQGYGFAQVVITNRTLDRAVALAGELGGSLVAAPWQERDLILEGADVLVNTTSLGLKDNPPLDVNLAALPVGALVTDVVYAPLITPLLAQAQARGNPVVDGLGMLMHQAVPAFEAWFGICPDVTPELKAYILS